MSAVVIPLHRADSDDRKEIAELVNELYERTADLPGDDLEPGYRLLAATRSYLQRAAKLLEAAGDLIEDAIEREHPRYNGYYEQLHPEEAQG